MSGAPFLEILGAWFVLFTVFGTSAATWVYFTRSPQQLTAMVDRLKTTVQQVKATSSKAVTYGKTFVVSHSSANSEEPLMAPHTAKD